MNITIKHLLIFCLLVTAGMYQRASAQLNPLGAQYFQNQYLSNPAMAALDSGLTVNLGYRQQTGSIDGAPKMQAVTGTYRLNQLGLGVNVFNEQSGLLQRTRAVATLAYHLPVGEDDQQLHLGFSVGALNEHINTKDIIGDRDDALVNDLNKNNLHFDGDIGLAYTGKGLTIQGALPDFRTSFSKAEDKSINRATFFTAISYRFNFGQEESSVSVEPKLCYRGVKGYENIMDIGASIGFMDNMFGVQGMYHSSKNFTGGVTINYKSRFGLLLLYNSQPPILSEYMKANVELGVKLHF